jgi:hypothetical protein
LLTLQADKHKDCLFCNPTGNIFEGINTTLAPSDKSLTWDRKESLKGIYARILGVKSCPCLLKGSSSIEKNTPATQHYNLWSALESFLVQRTGNIRILEIQWFVHRE